MAQIVKPDAGQLRLCEYQVGIAIYKVWDEKRCTLFATKDQIEGLPHCAKSQSDFGLLALMRSEFLKERHGQVNGAALTSRTPAPVAT